MKYLLFWKKKDINPKESAEISRRAREERGDEETYGKVILPPHYYATYKGVTVVEIDDPKQLANRMALVAPYTQIRVVPLISVRLRAGI
ncbi:MAG: hypothetical protein JSV27_08500 [Candidatus Bathyarchaeota archaeon]|nr:MAG: hypothetical protein JSV27_08500 [Candidatus Bathyarchaeota archaeon]